MSNPTPPVVLSIAGSDSSAGAGIQADLKTITALGAYAATVVTAVTAQNTQGVRGVHTVPPSMIAQQICAVMDDLEPTAIKIGMLTDAATVEAVASSLSLYPRRPVVYDPVMLSTSGHRLMSDEATRMVVAQLIPLCTLVTPNLPEASFFLSREITTPVDMEQAAADLWQRWGTSVVVKGGHLMGAEPCDVLCHAGHITRHTTPAVLSRNTHGTGCTFSSAIATRLAQGYPMEKAVAQAKQYIYQAIAQGKDLNIGHGHGPLCHFVRNEE